jgi:tetratricopeptide (TPR) repeat protein
MADQSSQPQQIALQNVTANVIRIGSISQTINYTQKSIALSSVVNEGLPPLPSAEIWQLREEQTRVEHLLRRSDLRLIGVNGAGGYGKSATIAQVCKTQADGLDQRLLWVNFQLPVEFRTFALWVIRSLVEDVQYEAIRDSFQVLDEAALCQEVLNRLTKQRCLLVMDNLETLFQSEDLWKFYGDFLNGWLGHDRLASKIILTSQFRLDLPNSGAWQWLELCGLKEAQGVALLAAEGVIGKEEDLAAFARAADGHPLLLTLAVNLLKRREKEDDDRPEILRLGKDAVSMLRGIVEAHRGDSDASVGKVLDVSFERLYPEWMKQLLWRLSVIRGPFGLEFAAAMVEEQVGLEEVRQLARWSFLQEKKVAGEWQFSFLPLIARYLRLGAIEAKEISAGHEGGIRAYLPMRDRILQAGTRASETIDIYAYQEIFHHLCELGRYGEAFENVYTADETRDDLDEFLKKRGFNQVRYEMYNRLAQEWKPETEEEWNSYATALRTLGEALSFLDRRDEALSTYQEALAIFKEINARLGEANVLKAIGDVLQFKKRSDEALSTYQEALAIFKEINARLGEANVLQAIGDVLQFKKRSDEALSTYQEALAIFKEINDRLGEANVLKGLGKMEFAQERYTSALVWFQNAVIILQEIQNQYGLGWAWIYVARTQVKLNQLYPAKQSYELAQAQFSAVSMDDLVAMCRQEMQPTNQQGGTKAVAPPIANDAPRVTPQNDLMQNHLADLQRKANRSKGGRSSSNNFWLWFMAGLLLVILIWWLKR